MSGEPFSLADCETTFGPDDWEFMGREVAAAPEFSPEQQVRIRAAFASARVPLPAPASDAA